MIDNLSFYNTQLSPSERTADGKPWLAVRLFVPRIEDIAHLLADNGIEMTQSIIGDTYKDRSSETTFSSKRTGLSWRYKTRCRTFRSRRHL